MSRLFGTDGVRGVANAEPLTPELAFRLGRVTAACLRERRERGGSRAALLVGRDTRISGPLLESALLAGVLSTGVDVLAGGILPTPAIAILTPLVGAAGGVALSASHNPFQDNGIKLFGEDGAKLSDETEAEIEARLSAADVLPRPTGAGLGRLSPLPGAERRYHDALREALRPGLDLTGLRLVVDCAHGAMYRVAPRLLRALGGHVTTIGARPDGTNINAGLGALHPGQLQARVRALPGAIGLAFDGDGDRLIAVDEEGEVRDGDHLLAIFARTLAARGALRGAIVVSTVMANLGLERALDALGIALARVRVGDRHVLEEMRRRGASLGGEQSGHIIFLEHAPTGDGLLSALQLLRIVRESGQGLRDLAGLLTKCPQVLVNVRVRARPPMAELPGVREVVAGWEEKLDGRGRILVRYSGTEPLARIMVEGDDRTTIEEAAHRIAAAVRVEIGASA